MLKGKTAVITGGSRGIGKAIALKMAENGANIAILYAGNEKAAEATVVSAREFGIRAACYQCDVSDFSKTKEAVDSIREEFGSIDILVNNAGIIRDNLLIRMSEEDFDKVIDTNLKGVFNMIKHIYPIMAKQRSGSVINITSVSGLMGNIGQMNYSAAKAGVVGITKTAAKELAMRSVRCNAIAPGFIDTDMTEKLSDSVKEGILSTVPLKKMGTAEDVANLALFLASDISGYITGEVIRIDGGLYI
ncbi:MAG: 3-oxoacyl-[acyl-carrier-protein] reductase [Anaerofustis sp.]